jgi:hypothetical protein
MHALLLTSVLCALLRALVHVSLPGSPSSTTRSLELVRGVAQAASGEVGALAAGSGGVDMLLGLQPSQYAWYVP